MIPYTNVAWNVVRGILLLSLLFGPTGASQLFKNCGFRIPNPNWIALGKPGICTRGYQENNKMSHGIWTCDQKHYLNGRCNFTVLFPCIKGIPQLIYNQTNSLLSYMHSKYFQWRRLVTPLSSTCIYSSTRCYHLLLFRL